MALKPGGSLIQEGIPGVYNTRYDGDGQSNKQPTHDDSFDERLGYRDQSWSRRKIIVIAVLLALVGLVLIGVTVGITLAIVDSGKDTTTQQTHSPLHENITKTDQLTTTKPTSEATSTPAITSTTSVPVTTSTTSEPVTTSTIETTDATSSLVTSTMSIETTTESCNITGRFYIWIPVEDADIAEQIFLMIDELMAKKEAVCSSTNLGLIQSQTVQRRKRTVEDTYLVIRLDVVSEEITKADVIELLTNANVDDVDNTAIRVDDVSSDCVLLGSTGSISETMCRNLGFIYSNSNNYEDKDIDWKGLPEFQEEHKNISCDPVSRDIAFCATFYPDCENGRQLCLGTCEDVEINCPLVYQALGFPLQYCDTLPNINECHGTIIKTTTPANTMATTTTSSAITMMPTTATPSPNNCKADQFACVTDGACIPDYWFCDNYQDCADNSDEDDCYCPDGTFRCEQSMPTTCIDGTLVCNNVPDCSDSSDEGDCSSKVVECEEGEFRCIKFPECINASRKCDGTEDCQDRSDEWYQCPTTTPPTQLTEFEVRLMQNNTETTAALIGRVEIRGKDTDGDFGTICGDKWSKEDAYVICRMLNQSFAGEAYAYSNAAFGQGSGDIMMTNVECHGTESNIGLCQSKRRNIHCSHQQDAAVSCGTIVDVPTPAPVKKSTVRLVNGGTCLEGLVQVYIEEEWRYVCDDRFDERDATVICRMLGFESGPGRILDEFGIGDGLFWLDEVKCQGNETDIEQCATNDPGVHDCLYYEAVGVVCGGIPEIDCNPEPACEVNTSCSFDDDDCCLIFPGPTLGEGSTRWIRHQAQMIGYSDHTTASPYGGVIFYRNTFGTEGDRATVMVNSMLQAVDSMAIETNLTMQFYFLVQSARVGTLSLKTLHDDGTHNVLWSSPYIPPELEGSWLYQCVDIPVLPTDTGYIKDIAFESRRGREQDELVAIDDISLEKGKCTNGITYRPCTFDVLSECDVEIICNKCVQEDTVFRWGIFSNTTAIPDVGHVLQNLSYGIDGNFMFADASVGIEGDKALMKFLVNKDASQRAVEFDYQLVGDSPSSLQISLTNDENKAEYVWRSRSQVVSHGKLVGCIQLPVVTKDIRLNFEAVRGINPLGDISLDNVKVVDNCPGYSNCVGNRNDCTYAIESPFSDDFTWTRGSIDDSGEMIQTYSVEDNQSPYGSRSRLVSPEFSLRGGLYQFKSSMLKRGTGTLKIYITNGFDYTDIHTEHMYYGDTFEDYCVTLTMKDLSGAVLVFESVKGSLGIHESIFNNTEVLTLKDVDLIPGVCKDDLVETTCSFEDNVCTYTIEGTPGSSPCPTAYEWTKTGGSLTHFLLKSDVDHTLGTKNGHYMSVAMRPGIPSPDTTIRFKPTRMQEINTQKALSFYIRIYNVTLEQSELYVNVSGARFDIKRMLLPVRVWQPMCVDLTDVADATVDVSITAKSVTCDLDDIGLLSIPCPGSLACSFDAEHVCGYVLENGWVHNEKYLQVSKVDSRLISPVFSLNNESCITLTVRSTTNGTTTVRGSFRLLDQDTLSYVYFEEGFILRLVDSEWRQLHLQIPLLSEAVFALSFSDIGLAEVVDVDDIAVSTSICNTLVCEPKEYACGNKYCIPSNNTCDGIEDCLGGSDETNCDECTTCYFNVSGVCLCEYSSLNIKSESGEKSGVCLCQYSSLNVKSESGEKSGTKFQFHGENMLSYIATPSLNLTSTHCLMFRAQYSEQDVRLRVLRNITYALFPLATFRFDVANEHMNVSLSLEPGFYSLIFEVITITTSSNRETSSVLTLDDIKITNGVCDSETSRSNAMSTPTDAPVNTTPAQGGTDVVQAYLFTDVTLTCSVNLTSTAEEMNIFWYKGGRQMTRNDEVLRHTFIDAPTDTNVPKYSVLLRNDTILTYNLTIRRISTGDAGQYECRLDIAGTEISIETSINVIVTNDAMIPTDDGCYRNTLEMCDYHDFETITYDGPFGRKPAIQDITETLRVSENSLTSQKCQSGIEALTCGLFTPKCINGKSLHICREYCLEIVSTCLREGSDVHQLLRYGCSFIQNSDEDPTCYSEWIGFGITHKSTKGIIWTENYPKSYPANNSSTYIEADKYHILQLEVVDFDIGIGNVVGPCYFEIYDEDKDRLIARRQCGEEIGLSTISTWGRRCRITFVSDNNSVGRGYKIAYEQVFQYGCKHILLDDDIINLTLTLQNENNACMPLLLYTHNERDSVVIEVGSVSQGCIVMSTINLNGGVTLVGSVCDDQNSVRFEVAGQVLLDIDEGAAYVISVQQKAYVRQVDSISLDDSGRLLMVSENQYGMACIHMNQQTADLVCQSFHLGWPAEIISDESYDGSYPSIVNDIRCLGTEQHITECQFGFEDEPKTCPSESFSAVKCKNVSLSCDFYNKTCGYDINGNIQYSNTDGLILKKSSYFTTLSTVGNILSPPFKYSDDSYVNFEYSVDIETDDQITIELLNVNSGTSMIMWERQLYRLSGHLTGCFKLPDNNDTDTSYRVVIILSSSLAAVGHSSFVTGIRRLTISPETCTEPVSHVLCTFEDPDTCALMIDLDDMVCNLQTQRASQVNIVTDTTLYRDGSWLKQSNPPVDSHNNYLLIDEGHNVTIVKNITAEVNAMQFVYAIYIAPSRESHLTWKLTSEGETILTVHDASTNWRSRCIDVQAYLSQPIVLQVGDTDNGKDGYSTMAIDNIQLSTESCPHQYSCAFEDSCIDNYSSVKGMADWVKTRSGTAGFPRQDVTYRDNGKGSFMVPDFNNGTEGTKAVMEIENVGNAAHCLAFFVYSGANSSDMIEVVINKKIRLLQHPIVFDEWTLHNVDVSGYTESIRFVATRGHTSGILAIDEVVLTETPCTDNIDASNVCTFNNPNLCNMDLPYTNRSQFKLRKMTTHSTHDLLSQVRYDADGNPGGSFMFLEGSDADQGHSAEVGFTLNTSKSAYRFWYYVFDLTAIADLPYIFTAIDDVGKSTVDIRIRNNWVMSPCFTLPTPFKGRLSIGARLEHGIGRLVAIDQLQLLDLNTCQAYSPSCDFEEGQVCGYVSEGHTWTHTRDSWVAIRSGNLTVPSMNLINPHCYEFVYEAYDTHTVDGKSTLTLYNDEQEVWSQYAMIKTGNPKRLTTRINLQGGDITLKFHSEGLGVYTIWKARLTEGACPVIEDCDEATEFQCQNNCIDNGMVCNRVVDCLGGEDESEPECDFKLKTDFNTVDSIEQRGFAIGSESSADWSLLPYTSLIVNGRRANIEEKTLATQFNTLTITPSIVESREYYLSMETSCLYISYYGNVTRFSLHQHHIDPVVDVEYNITLNPSLSKRHIAVPVQGGRVKFTLSVYMTNLDPYFRADLPNSALFGLYSFDIHEGRRCTNLSLSCPSDIPHMCGNKMNCYTANQKCDLISDCIDNSDETDDCGYAIPCDFEHPNMCGYHNLTVSKTYWDDRDVYQTPQILWERTYSSSITRPRTDHTFRKSGEGHFMTSKNYEGLQDENRYVDTEIMQSPFQTFENDGCLTFWYYLNSTAHQPKTGTAQLFVYLHYGNSKSKELLWYDHVNRPFTDWVQGGIPVAGRQNVSLIIKAVTFIPYDSWTGVVSLDDIEFHSGECEVKKPECDDSMYRCDDHICIPHEFVCDGEEDCHHGNDERSCNRPDGGLQLVGGDGSYGQLGFFYDGQWRPVCYPEDIFEKRTFILHTAHAVCRTLGFSGNFDALPYRLWSKYSDTSIVLSCDGEGNCTGTPTMDECGFYAYIKCSDDVCFAGETLCPGTVSTCKPRHYFCDGETDCPENTDERNCKCFEDEHYCLHLVSECLERECETCGERGMFECKNHQCLPKSERCDGITQCTDGTDEYRCVQIDKEGVVTVYDRHSLQRKIVCVDGIDVNSAQTLCELSGMGYVSEILRGNTSISDGVSLRDFEAFTASVQGFSGSCFPLKLLCHMTECGTTSIQDSLVQSYVINGRDATIEEWPWYGALIGNGFLYCGVALLSPEWALTSTHCIYPGVDYSIVLGSDKRDGSGDWTQTRSISRVFNYGYIATGEFPIHDITLLKLSEPVQINNYTRPVCLPQHDSAEYINDMGIKAECYLVGLGATEHIFNDPSSYDYFADTLQKKRVRSVPNDVCEREWRKGVPTDDPFPSNVVCFAHEGPSSISCFGDSGGSIMCKNARGRWELFGSISFGFGNCLHDIIPTVATSVLQYGDWIEEVTGLSP